MEYKFVSREAKENLTIYWRLGRNFLELLVTTKLGWLAHPYIKTTIFAFRRRLVKSSQNPTSFFFTMKLSRTAVANCKTNSISHRLHPSLNVFVKIILISASSSQKRKRSTIFKNLPNESLTQKFHAPQLLSPTVEKGHLWVYSTNEPCLCHLWEDLFRIRMRNSTESQFIRTQSKNNYFRWANQLLLICSKDN